MRLNFLSVAQRQLLRYLLAGAANTLGTWLLFVALSRWMNYLLAYTIMFVIGIVTSYVLQSLWVFNRPLQLAAALRFKATFLINLLLGLLMLKLIVSYSPLTPAVAALAVAALQIPTGFLLSRFSLTTR